VSSVGAVYSSDLIQFLDLYMSTSNERLQELQDERDSLDIRRAVYSDLQTKLRSLRDLAEDLSATGSLSAFGAKSTASSDATVLTATAGTGAASMAHALHVQQLARAHSVLSNRYTSSGTDLSASWAGTKRFTVTVDDDDYIVSVSIGEGDTNEDVLKAVSNAINDVTDIPVRASQLNDTDSTSKLYLASTETGAANKMTFTDTDGLLAALGVTNGSEATDTVGGYLYADLGGNELDAQFTVDGIQIVKSSNTVDDVIRGVTLTLLNEQEETDADITLTVSVDNAAIKTKVGEFLKAYNDAYDYLKTKISVNASTYERGDLAGDYTYVNLWQRMRSLVAGPVSTVDNGTYSALSQIGISSSSTGQFSISDADKFDGAVTGHLGSVEELFNSAGGVAVALEDLLDDFTSSAGLIWSSKDALNEKAHLLDARIERMGKLQEIEQESLIKQYGAYQQATYTQQAVMSMLSNLTSWLNG
jgi:flagellar hook-associated protein 2